MTTPSRLVVLSLLLIGCDKFTAAQVPLARCTAVTTNVQFAGYTGATAIRVTATLTLDCSGQPVFAISLNSGTAAGATVINRSMTAPSGQLNYGLFSDPGYINNWGNTPGTGWVTGTSNGTVRRFTIYAQLPANQLKAPNLYDDTITALILPLSGSNFDPVVTRFTVSATVLTSCTLSATDLAFGNYSGSLIDAVSTLSVNCTIGIPYNVGLNAGTALFATVTNRRMQGPGSTRLNYSLLRDPARANNWGNTITSKTDTVAEMEGAPEARSL